MQSYYFYFLSACGGIKNITRLLKQGNRWCCEVEKPELCLSCEDSGRNEKESFVVDSALNQLIFSPEYQLTEKEVTAICLNIERRQQEKLQPHLQVITSNWRPSWHVAPPQGLLNDPNGFIFHQGKYHLFYQWYPYSCEHTDKHWVHLESEDLLHWDNKGVALTPSHWFDSHGAFSGHALSLGDDLYLFYTGNVRLGARRERFTTQCVARSADKGEYFTKLGPVITKLPPNATPHCRDPKIIAYGNHWLMLLGVQIQHGDELRGRLAVYSSQDLRDWEFEYIAGDELGDYGYMWECPDYFELDGQAFSVICPQGIDVFSDYHHSPHKNIYLNATFKEERLQLKNPRPLDYGFDFYAPQTALSPDGRRLLVAWMGLPDEIRQPSVADGWLHQLTGLRELSVRDGCLYQQPVRELMQLEGAEKEIKLTPELNYLGSKSLCIETQLNYASMQELNLFADTHFTLKLIVDPQKNELRLDRSQTLDNDGDDIRALSLDILKESNATHFDVQILMDNSSVEIYFNHGAQVMSARVFTPEDATAVSFTTDSSEAQQLKVSYWIINAAA